MRFLLIKLIKSSLLYIYIFIYEAESLSILPEVLVYANPVWPYQMDGGRYSNGHMSPIRRRSLVIKATNKYFRSGAKFGSSRIILILILKFFFG